MGDTVKNEIDIVILWVDGNDVVWQKEKEKYQQMDGQDARNNRYRDWGTLQFLFRGIEKFAPWVNKIHLVTCGQVPKWLNLDNPKIHLVTHKEFISQEFLPTFSSRAIDLNLHKIPGLAEKFIYFNDDMFILKPLSESMFFRNNLPCDIFSERAICCSGNGETVIAHTFVNNMEMMARHFKRRDVMKKNWRKILNIRYGKTFFYNLLTYLLPYKNLYGLYMHHLPMGYLKHNFEEIWAMEEKALTKTVSHKFRNINDVNQFIFRFWPLLKGEFYPYNMDKLGKSYGIYSNRDQINAIIENQSKHLICLNDDCNDEHYLLLKDSLINSFKRIFPEKSAYELYDEYK